MFGDTDMMNCKLDEKSQALERIGVEKQDLLRTF
jgi:hypothetical protein